MSSVELITQEEWITVGKRRLKKSDLELVNHTVKRLGDAGGFLGEHFLAEVTVREKDSSEPGQTLHFFLKSEPRGNEDQKAIVAQSGSFVKEVGALSELFPLLRSALRDGGKGMEWTCECFFTRPDVIVLENLLQQGYSQVGAREQMGLEQCAAVLRALANLHAASLVAEEARGARPRRLADEHGAVLAEGFFRRAPAHPGAAWLRAGADAALALLALVRGAAAARRNGARLHAAMGLLFEFARTSTRFRNAVGHGDLWNNNLFFRRGDGGELEARLVDFQLVRYVPPACDVVCFLQMTTTRRFRRDHLSDLHALYYGHLARNLQRHGLDPEQVLSQKEFRESCEFYRKLGPVVAAQFVPFIKLNPEDVSHVFASSVEFERFMLTDRTPEIVKAFKSDPVYRESVTEAIELLLEECIEDST